MLDISQRLANDRHKLLGGVMAERSEGLDLNPAM